MKKTQSKQGTRRHTPAPASEHYSEHRQHQREAAEARHEQQAKGERAHREATHQTEDLESRIEALLSANPQEFVIRFLQTEGQ